MPPRKSEFTHEKIGTSTIGADLWEESANMLTRNDERHEMGFIAIRVFLRIQYPLVNVYITMDNGKSPFYSCVNPLFLWPFSKAILT
jgi:hypothetical protein